MQKPKRGESRTEARWGISYAFSTVSQDCLQKGYGLFKMSLEIQKGILG